MRTYGQYCAMAKALDVIGDRWSLLVVRELLVRGGSRYTDLLDGLPGIATNLLADRLHDLEEAGVIVREVTASPFAVTRYHLTPRGAALRPVMKALGAWGGPLLATAPDGDAFRSHWLTLPAEELLHDRTPDEPPVTIEVRTTDEPIVIETIDGEVRARTGAARRPDLVLSGPHRVIVRFLAGRLALADAQAAGLGVDGNLDAIRRLQPVVSPLA
jgi:DNA-binding HxlR family transcriptional regulator